MKKLNISYSQLEALINEWILSERDRRIMKRRLLDGISLESLSEEFGMCPRQMHTIVKKNAEKLQEHCL